MKYQGTCDELCYKGADKLAAQKPSQIQSEHYHLQMIQTPP